MLVDLTSEASARFWNDWRKIFRCPWVKSVSYGSVDGIPPPKAPGASTGTVKEIVGGGTPEVVTGVRLQNTVSNTESVLPADGVFIAIGHSPNTAVFGGHVDMDSEGYIRTVAGSTRTSVPGVFAAGDVQDKIFRQAVTAAGTGCMAALEAEKYIAEHEMRPSLAAE